MIQVIPFYAEQDPFFLPLLARGLTDLSTLRFNMMELPAQVNIGLTLPDPMPEEPASPRSLDGEELWLGGELRGGGEITMTMVVYSPERNSAVFQTTFKAKDSAFLEEWENQLHQLILRLNHNHDQQPEKPENPKIFTHSLDAFLSFRRGLETISLAKNEKVREDGINALLESVAYDPEFTEAADILILYLMQNGFSQDFEKVIAVLEKLRGLSTGHPRIPLVMAEVYHQWGNREKTEQLLKELVASFPQFTDGWIRLALFYHSYDQPQEALEALEAICRYNPDDPTTLDLMGAIYVSRNEQEKAALVWQRVLEIDPERVNVLNNLGLLAEETGEAEKAEAYYQRAIELNKEWWGSFYHYGAFCRRNGRLEEAAELLSSAAQLNPEHFLTLHQMSLIQVQLGRYADAQETLLKLLQIAPDNQSRRQTLQLLDQLEDPEIKIESRIRRLEKIWDAGKRWMVLLEMVKLGAVSRRRWYYWYLWGRISAAFKLPFIAAFFWKRSMRREPGFVLYKELGFYYWKRNRLAKALPLLRQAYQLNQSDQEVARIYMQTLIGLGALEELHANIRDFSQHSKVQSPM